MFPVNIKIQRVIASEASHKILRKTSTITSMTISSAGILGRDRGSTRSACASRRVGELIGLNLVPTPCHN